MKNLFVSIISFGLTSMVDSKSIRNSFTTWDGSADDCHKNIAQEVSF
jgi:hypothetical protein